VGLPRRTNCTLSVKEQALHLTPSEFLMMMMMMMMMIVRQNKNLKNAWENVSMALRKSGKISVDVDLN
jgi:preprotein translocase subunit YajC